MCGICGYIGYNNGFEYIYFGIHMLLNRGYDSIGMCSINDNKLILNKYSQKPDIDILKLIESHKDNHGSICMGHTRWATHGKKTDENSHPHLDYTDRFALVHNGIIENYSEIKDELINKYKISFRSQTDSEVVVNLISIMYDKYNCVEKAITETINKLQGTWGFVVITTERPDKMYCARHGSPLLIGFGDDFMMVASEQSGFCKYVNNYICLNDNDVVVLEKKNNKVNFIKKNEYTLRPITISDTKLTPDPYPYWTIREINEQIETCLRAMGMGGRIVNDKIVKLGGLDPFEKELKDINHIILLGCGTSYNAGMHCLNIFKTISGFDTVQIFDGAEFNNYDVPKTGKTGLIFISQSGETKDLHRCIDIGKDMSLYMIGVVNVVDSLIAREVHCGVYLNAGREVGVASTKAFSSQVIVLNLIAIWFSQIRMINETKRKTIIKDMRQLSIDIKKVIKDTHKQTKIIAQYLLNKHTLFILGKSNNEAVAKEGSLKIKEIGYLHAEGYNSSALKHGTYAIIDEGTPIILIIPNDEHFIRNQGIIEELKSRDAYVVAISDKITNKVDIQLTIPTNKSFYGLLSSVPLQLIAYELALLKGHNPDLPKGLAKCITTD